MPTYNTFEDLLTAIYAGNNIAKHTARDKKKQDVSFPEKGTEINPSVDLTHISALPLDKGKVGLPIEKSIINHAISAYNKPALKFLLTNQPGLANYFAKHEKHPLYNAASLNSVEMVEILLQHGADPNQNMSHTLNPNGTRDLKILEITSGYSLANTIPVVQAIQELNLSESNSKLNQISKMVSNVAAVLRNAAALRNARVVAANLQNHPPTQIQAEDNVDHQLLLSSRMNYGNASSSSNSNSNKYGGKGR